MGYTKFTKKDRNRYKKVYPFVKRTPQWAYMSNANFQMEVGKVEFEGETILSVKFASSFPKPPDNPPVVTATSLDPQQAINVTAFNISNVGFDVSVSNSFYGNVMWHAIWIEE